LWPSCSKDCGEGETEIPLLGRGGYEVGESLPGKQGRGNWVLTGEEEKSVEDNPSGFVFPHPLSSQSWGRGRDCN
jgi:hypothetical protein